VLSGNELAASSKSVSVSDRADHTCVQQRSYIYVFVFFPPFSVQKVVGRRADLRAERPDQQQVESQDERTLLALRSGNNRDQLVGRQRLFFFFIQIYIVFYNTT